MVSIVIPAYNMQDTIEMAIDSALTQDYPNKEIIVVDDASSDKTALYAQIKGIRTVVNDINLGIGRNLTMCMWEARGDVIVYLCGDDFFADRRVISDMMEIFDGDSRVGVVGRQYYQFINGIPGAVNRVRQGILESSINPSGIGFRKRAMIGTFGTSIFTEMPYMVKKILSAGWGYQILDYDTVAVRIHANNTCVKSSYYNDSPTLSFNTIVPGHTDYGIFPALKNRCPSLLLKEIGYTIKIKPLCLLSPKFWIYVIVSTLIPSYILVRLGNFFRHRINRRFCDIKLRVR